MVGLNTLGEFTFSFMLLSYSSSLLYIYTCSILCPGLLVYLKKRNYVGIPEIKFTYKNIVEIKVLYMVKMGIMLKF